ncbi:MAG: hypothetical protein O7G31_00525 [Calditrichaeota bacterium]|nr:hypothetical protein [Calditrichota bacterium]
MPDRTSTPETRLSNLQEFDACINDLSRRITGGETCGLPFVSEALSCLGLTSFVQSGRTIAIEFNIDNLAANVTLVHFVLNSNGAGLDSYQERFQALLPAAMGVCLAAFFHRYEGSASVRIIFDAAVRVTQSASGADEDVGNATRVLGVSCDPAIPAGCVGVKFGVVHPRFDRLVVELFRDASATAHSDLLEVAGHVVTSLTQITARKTDPLTPARVAFEAFDKSLADKTSRVVLTGTIWALAESATHEIHKIVEKTLQAMATAYGIGCNCTIEEKQPSLQSDSAQTENLKRTAVETVGKDAFVDVEYLHQDLTGLAAYLKKLPGTVLFVGSGGSTTTSASEILDEVKTAKILRTGLKVLCAFLPTPA